MKKEAQSFQTRFEQAKPSLSGIPEIARILSVNEIIYEQSAPSDKPDSLAYVTNADENSDGKIDKIHFVIPNMNNYFNNDYSDENFNNFLKIIGHTILHERGHQVDAEKAKNTSSTEPFPQGEAAAEQHARQFDTQLDTMIQNLSSRTACTKLERLKKFLKSN